MRENWNLNDVRKEAGIAFEEEVLKKPPAAGEGKNFLTHGHALSPMQKKALGQVRAELRAESGEGLP